MVFEPNLPYWLASSLVGGIDPVQILFKGTKFSLLTGISCWNSIQFLLSTGGLVMTRGVPMSWSRVQ